MFCAANKHNSYESGYDINWNPAGYDALRCVSNKLAGEVDLYSDVSLNEIRKGAISDKDAYPLSSLSISEEGSTGSDEYHSSCEQMSWESASGLEFQKNRNANYRLDQNDVGHSQPFGRKVGRHLLPAGSMLEKLPLTDEMRLCNGYSSTEFPDEVSGINPRDLWHPPTSPIDYFPQSPNHKIYPDSPRFFSNQATLKDGFAKSSDDQRLKWTGEQVTSKSSDLQDGSFLFAMADNAGELKIILRQRGLEIQDVWETRMPGVVAVLFSTHELAKQAFTRQKEIGIRLVPQSTTRRYWYKNPSPKFHVIYETNRRLTVKSGKSFSNRILGDFLMKNSRMDRGCIIWADQMKGYRLRVVGFVGKFVSRDGRVIIRDKPPSPSEREIIGWISTQCNITKMKFVSRLSGNQIEDYLYNKPLEILE